MAFILGIYLKKINSLLEFQKVCARWVPQKVCASWVPQKVCARWVPQKVCAKWVPQKFCARWVPQKLTDEMKAERIKSFKGNSEEEGEGLLRQIVRGDKI